MYKYISSINFHSYRGGTRDGFRKEVINQKGKQARLITKHDVRQKLKHSMVRVQCKERGRDLCKLQSSRKAFWKVKSRSKLWSMCRNHITREDTSDEEQHEQRYRHKKVYCLFGDGPLDIKFKTVLKSPFTFCFSFAFPVSTSGQQVTFELFLYSPISLFMLTVPLVVCKSTMYSCACCSLHKGYSVMEVNGG